MEELEDTVESDATIDESDNSSESVSEVEESSEHETACFKVKKLLRFKFQSSGRTTQKLNKFINN